MDNRNAEMAEQPNTMTKTMEETDRKCPQCEGVMDFNPTNGKLTCPFCGYEEEIGIEENHIIPQKQGQSQKEGTALEQEFDPEQAEKMGNSDWGVASKTVICKACGAETIYDQNDISAVCPFCGSNQVMEAADQFSLAPNGVVPFKIDQKQAAAKFASWINGKFFCPGKAKESAKAKHFKGVYLPYWTFDAMTHSNYIGQYGIDHTTRDSDGNSRTRTEWHSTTGNFSMFVDDQLVCGTTRHNKKMLLDIEPYHTAENVAYKPEYVAGFSAEKYSVGLKDAWVMAKNGMTPEIRSGIESQIMDQYRKADRADAGAVKTDYTEVTYKYLLLPVWFSSFKYNGKVYQFVVNGQTGAVSGDSPISVPKVILTVVGLILIVLIVLFFYI